MKIFTIVGARPQFVKAAVVSKALKEQHGITEIILHTGQHYDENMSEIFFSEMGIPAPKYNLGISDMDTSVMTGKISQDLNTIIKDESPDFVLVYGDTNSTLAGALVAKQNRIKLAHVEAGLRSFNMNMLEELNRVIVDRISDLLFCPTDMAMNNLRNEGFDHFKCRMIMSGDVMYDASLYFAEVAQKKSKVLEQNAASEFILVTLHRSENVDHQDKLSSLVDALNEISKSHQIILPLHPRTKKRMNEFNLKFAFETIEPVGYLDMIQLLSHCTLVMTDGGGLQKEAFFFKKHCVTLRDKTEWMELVKHGFNVIAGTEKESILKAYKQMNSKESNFDISFYGNGNAGNIIVSTLLSAI